jgi:hypothetical protein
VLQSRMGRRVDGGAAGQCRIMPHVRADCPRVPPVGVLACYGELAPHASLRGSSCIGMSPHRVDRVLVGDRDSSCEQAGCRGEAETPRERRRLVEEAST